MNQGSIVRYIHGLLGSTICLLVAVCMMVSLPVAAQTDTITNVYIDYNTPREYTIAHITVKGTENLDKSILISLSGLRQGEKIKIPGEDISKAIKNLWKQRLFTDVSVDIEKVVGDEIFLQINVQDRPRIGSYSLKGIKNADVEELKKKLDLRAGIIFSDNLKKKSIEVIRNYYIDKGFLNVVVAVRETPDTTRSLARRNSTLVNFYIDKGAAVKIRSINFEGVSAFTEPMLKHKMKETKERVKFQMDSILRFRSNFKKFGYHPKWYTVPGSLSPVSWYSYLEHFVNLNVFKASKFRRKEFEEDKKKVIEFYNTKGYRDARIVYDTVYREDPQNLVINIKIDEGRKYYFRNIFFNGNTKYPDSLLAKIINIHRGEVYNAHALEEKLFSNPNGGDVSSLYMDDGYLFFSITPAEVRVEGDSIDVELRISEGPQATINEVRIMGNTKTNEKVIRRELRTLPGNKFSRSDLIRSQREIINLGYFDPQQLDVVPIPNAENGTVDIEYRVTEKPSDQLELSAGYGGSNYGLTGTLGVTFTNFSLRNIINKKSWNPLPSGDGQRLSVRVQSGGKMSQFYTLSFTEPWLGGKKPNSLTFAFNRTNIYSYDNGLTYASTGHYFSTGGTVSWATRLKKPDDFFTFEAALTYQYYQIVNSSYLPIFSYDNGSGAGNSHNLNLSLILSRNSLDQVLYPKHGSSFMLSVTGTLPYSRMFPGRMRINYSDTNVTPEQRYKYIEFFKVKFFADWYTTIYQNLVFRASAKFGFLGTYNSQLGLSPFERFEVGGDGISTYSILGKEIVRLRGYDVISPTSPPATIAGAAIFNKFTAEIRYPISLNPSATIFALAFLEGGNTWQNIRDYRPYMLNKSVGIGVRVFLPMFGLLGLDYGFPLDKVIYSSGSKANPNGRINIVLGQEPE
ncbi:MAG: outer membrane protein assembly factor [Bacteroidetes bacterium]|nr:outer membrane protein assembly factor [Bacteroidota bacterium]